MVKLYGILFSNAYIYILGVSVCTVIEGLIYGPLPTTVLAATAKEYSVLPKREEAVKISSVVTTVYGDCPGGVICTV